MGRTDRTDRQLCNSCDVVSISPNITKLVNVSTFSKGKAGCTENILCVTHIELKWPPQDSTAQTSCQVYFCTVVFVFVLFILERNVYLSYHFSYGNTALDWDNIT